MRRNGGISVHTSVKCRHGNCGERVCEEERVQRNLERDDATFLREIDENEVYRGKFIGEV